MKTNKLTGKKVALVTRLLGSGGGLEKYGRYIASYLQDKGALVTLVTESLPSTLDKRYSYKQIPSKGSRHQKITDFSKKAANFTKTHEFDVVIGLDRTLHQTHLRAGNGLHAAFLDKKRKAHPFIQPLKTWINRSNSAILEYERKALLDPYLKRIITNSKLVADEIATFYPNCKAQVTTIHNGVQWQSLSPHFEKWQETKNQLLKMLGLSHSNFFFLFVGHGYKRKGLCLALKALSLIKDERVHLLVAGKDKNPSYFKALTKKLGLTKRVHFLGPQKHVTPLFALADSVIIPSLYDPFANVTVEALAMGVYVVSSAFNGGKEVLTSQSGTVIEDLMNKQGFASALKKALNHKKTALSSKAIRDSISHLDFSSQLEHFVNAIVEDL